MKNKNNSEYKKYNIDRVAKLFWDHFGLYVIRENYGYKGNRYRRYVTYTVKDELNNVIMEHVTLSALGDSLVKEDLY